MHSLKGVAGKPVLGGLGSEMLQEQVHLPTGDFLGKRNENIRLTEVSVVFEDLVFKNQVVSERIPGEV
jgi:hypothetical protein